MGAIRSLCSWCVVATRCSICLLLCNFVMGRVEKVRVMFVLCSIQHRTARPSHARL